MLLSTHIRRGRSLVFLSFLWVPLSDFGNYTYPSREGGTWCWCDFAGKATTFWNLTEFDILTKWGLSAPIKRDNIHSTFIYVSNYTPTLVITKTYSDKWGITLCLKHGAAIKSHQQVVCFPQNNSR